MTIKLLSCTAHADAPQRCIALFLAFRVGGDSPVVTSSTVWPILAPDVG
jgi:hypothetical protein